MYKYLEICDNKYILSLDNHVQVMEALMDFCAKKHIGAGSITGIGAVNEATFRFLDPATKKYVDKTFAQQMEITNFTGNISVKDGKPYLHVHCTASRSDYSCIGGHLLEARINGACELVIEQFGLVKVDRYLDEETGLNLYKL